MNIQLVPLVHVDQVFPQCEELFDQAIKRGGGDDLTLPYLFSECRSGRAFLYVNAKNDKITDAMILRFENPSIARILVMGGEGCDWAQEITNLGKSIKNYADKIVFEGRKGWQRKLPVKVKAIVYEMKI